MPLSLPGREARHTADYFLFDPGLVQAVGERI
jgi:hypothetical protein